MVARATSGVGRSGGKRWGAGVAGAVALSLLYPFVVPRVSGALAPRLLPAAANAYLFGVFAWTLRHGPPMIERFARVIERGALPEFTLPYCRKVTMVWCGVFALNGIMAFVLAITGPVVWWTAYTGVGMYLLIAALLVGETVLHKWWFRYFPGGPIDRILVRVFPPEATANGRRSLAWLAAQRPGGSPGALEAGHDPA